jgi:rhodanese-related sulfurtransferase
MLASSCAALSPPPAGAALRCRSTRLGRCAALRVRACASADSSWVDCHAAKLLLEREGFVALDVRSKKEYEREHLVKPVKTCFSAPFAGAEPAAFAAAAEKALGRAKSRGVLVLTSEGGDEAANAAAAVRAAGYEAARPVTGGYTEWRKHYTASGRATPPPGRWMPTGQEALKSGLGVEGDPAASYEEKLNVQDLTKK